MKYITLVLLVLLPLFCKSQTTSHKNNLHSSINVTGGDISSGEGSVSFSIGQVYYLSHNERAPPESVYSESVPPVNRNTASLFYTETFEISNLHNNPDPSDFYPEFAVDHSSLNCWYH